MGQAHDRAIGTDPDQQGAAVGVQEAGDRLDDGVLHGLARLALAGGPSAWST